MPYALRALTIALLACSGRAAGAQINRAARDSLDAVRAITAARLRSNEAIARHDTAGIGREMVPDASVLSSTGALGTTRAENLQRMAATFARRPDTKWVRSTKSIDVFGAWDVAAERGTWVGTWTEPDGAVTIEGTYQAQWRRTGGVWRIQGELFVPLTCRGSSYCLSHP